MLEETSEPQKEITVKDLTMFHINKIVWYERDAKSGGGFMCGTLERFELTGKNGSPTYILLISGEEIIIRDSQDPIIVLV